MPTAQQKEAAAQVMEHLVDHDWHGYTWDARWGDGEGTCPVDTVIGTLYVEQGDRDCSSSVIDSYQTAGISCGGATYTGNMVDCMCGTGNFRAHWMSNGDDCDDGYIAQRGDCYVNIVNHTAFCLSAEPDMLAEFCINELGGVYGGQTGDQTGGESRRAAYYAYPWDVVLECIVDGNSGNTPSPEPSKPAEPARSEARGLQLYPSNGSDAQKWRQNWIDKTWFTLENVACGKVLDVNGNLNKEGTSVIVYPSNNGENQQWRFEKREGEIETHIVPRIAQDKCLDCKDGGHNQGTGIIIWPQHNGMNQDWVVLDNHDGTVTLINNSIAEKLALDVINGGA